MSGPEDLETEVDARAPADTEAAFHVRVLQGPDAGAGITVEASAPSSLLVGKSKACQLVLSDPKVSRRHVALDVAEGVLRVTDLRSTNGTTVNGVLIAEATLKGGEVIGVGATTLHVARQLGQQSRLTPALSFGRVVGASVAMRRLYPLCERLAASDTTIVIEGETGTGKELLAEEIHAAGARQAAPFVVFDCSAVAPGQADAVLFGSGETRGLFEQAHTGTLLIDEITELPAPLQAKLLRAIERGEVTSADRSIRVDVRVIATTRRDLEKEVEAGRFREDLYFRLAVARIELPPLRRRHGDDVLLANYFTKQLGAEHTLPADFLRRYEGYGWPGNVRELQTAVGRRLALGDTGFDDEDADVVEGAPENAFRWILDQDLPFSNARDTVLAEFEHGYVERVLKQHGGNVSRAAAASGLARRYFQILRARSQR